MKLTLLLCIPALATAGNYSGTITDLAGAALAGVTISSTGFTTTTDAQGHWALGSATGISAQAGLTHSVSRHLVMENGHIGLVWNGANIQGRMTGVRMGGAAPAMPGAARSAVALDTIVVQWNGKRLFRLPVTGDSSGIAFSIDTAWSDDGGVAWNPKISYGSVSDLAGQTYRTVMIGKQMWMAQNLNYAGATGTTGGGYNNGTDSCSKYGRFYTWTEVMKGAVSSTISPSGIEGICPNGWHVPSDSEWTTMQRVVDSSNTTYGTKFKSTNGWHNGKNGTDTYGFRVLPAGYRDSYGTVSYVEYGTGFWSASESSVTSAWYRDMYYSYESVHRSDSYKTDGLSLRCSKD